MPTTSTSGTNDQTTRASAKALSFRRWNSSCRPQPLRAVAAFCFGRCPALSRVALLLPALSFFTASSLVCLSRPCSSLDLPSAFPR